MWKLVHNIFVGHIYNRLLVDTGGHWCKIITSNMPNLSLKIFRRSTVLKLVLKFQNKLGDPRPLSISILWPISKIAKILALESARIPEHFQCCVILGHPSMLKYPKSETKKKNLMNYMFMISKRIISRVHFIISLHQKWFCP